MPKRLPNVWDGLERGLLTKVPETTQPPRSSSLYTHLAGTLGNQLTGIRSMKNYLISTMSAALLACAGFSAPALAQDKATSPANADKTQVVPGKKDLATSPVTVEKLDDNTQRQHDRNSGAASQGRATNARTGVKAGNADNSGNANTQARLPPGEVRDWSAIDKNKDNLISPEEMESALAESRSSSTTSK